MTTFKRLMAALAFLLLAGMLTACSSQPKRPAETTPTVQPTAVVTNSTARLVVDPNISDKPKPPPTKPGISIPGWGGLRISARKTEVDVPLYNPVDNAGWYYLTFKLVLKETGEELFSTGLIPPDMYCTSVTLTRPMEAGHYPCQMIVQPYTIADDPAPTNNAVYDVDLFVE